MSRAAKKHIRIPFGKHSVYLYKREDVEHSSWYFRVHIKEEEQDFRKSLDTPDITEAKEKLHDEVINLLTKVKSGQRIFATSLRELVKRFSLQQEADVKAGLLAERTLELQRYRVYLGVEFIKSRHPAQLDTKLTAINGEEFKDYLNWRLKRTKARRDVIRDELLVIRKMFRYAKENKLCTEENIPVWKFDVEKDPPKRQRFNVKVFYKIPSALEAYRHQARNERETYTRVLMQHLFMFASHSGMRSGEIFGLKNSDVTVHKQANEVVVHIRKETSKVRKERTITVGTSIAGRRIDSAKTNYLIQWLTRHQRHKQPTDYVFSSFTKGTISCRDGFYHSYGELRKLLKKDDLEWFDLYHCRHFWITNMLYAGEPIYMVATAAGTSTKEIEVTYSHVLTEMATRQMGKKRVIHDEEKGYTVELKEQLEKTLGKP